MICKCCSTPIKPPKRMFCSRKCSGKYRRDNFYKDKYTTQYRNKSPRNFMMCLINKQHKRSHLSVDDLVEIYNRQEGKCALSGLPMTYMSGEGRVPTNISLDRRVPSLGYTLDNIQLVCVQANKMKSELSEEELRFWCKCILGV